MSHHQTIHILEMRLKAWQKELETNKHGFQDIAKRNIEMLKNDIERVKDEHRRLEQDETS